LRNCKAPGIISRLWEVFCRWGFPKSIVSDNGSQFTSKLYLNFCTQNGLSPLHIAPYHPQANITERYNQTVKGMIVSTIDKCKDWDKRLHEMMFALNSSVSSATEFSPAYVNFGRELRYPLDNSCGLQTSSINHSDNLALRMAYIRCLARDNIVQSQIGYMSHYNKHRKVSSFEVGDKVLLKLHVLSDASKKITSSLMKRYSGPYVISQKVTDSIYELKCPTSSKILGRYHVKELKLYYSDNESGVQNECGVIIDCCGDAYAEAVPGSSSLSDGTCEERSAYSPKSEVASRQSVPERSARRIQEE
jgi:hypothetical protein